MAYGAYADLMNDTMSPLTKAGIDPDEARMDRAGAMAKLMGAEAAPYVKAPETPSWMSATGAPPAIAQPPVPAAVAPATPAAQPTTRPSLSDLSYKNTTAAMDSADRADSTLADLQNNASPNTSALEAQRAKAATPIAAFDPATGKPLAQYKPTFGQRLMRGVEGFAGGGILGAIDPKLGGAQAYGAPNAKYGRDVAAQQSQVASLDQQIGNEYTNAKSRFELAKGVAAEQGKAITARNDIGKNIVAEQEVGGKDKVANLAQEHSGAVMDAIRRGVDPSVDPKVKNIEDSMTRVMPEHAGKAPNKDDQFIAIQQKIAQKIPLTPEETSYLPAYHAYVKMNKIDPAAVRVSAMLQMPQAVVDPNDPSREIYTTRKGAVGMEAPGSGDAAAARGTLKYMTSGQGGQTLNAGQTLTHHLDLYDQAVDAVHNGDVKVLNKIGNEFGVQLGNNAQTNLALIRQGVAMEAARFYTGGVPGEHEINQFSQSLSGDGSPKQMHGGATTVRAMAHGKMQSLKEQSDAGAKGKANFSAESGPSTPKEGTTKQNSHGDSVTFKNGKWGPS